MKSATMSLIYTNVIIFIIQVILGDKFTMSFALIPGEVLVRPWIIITSMFLHANLTHLLFNMYALLIFGLLIERRIGIKKFLIIYFGSGIIAGIVATIYYSRIGTATAVLGASGAIMGILGLTIIILPDLPVLLFFFIPMKLRTVGILIAFIDIFGLFNPMGIANIAHLAGMATGAIYGWNMLSLKKKANKIFTIKPNSSTELTKEELEKYMKYGKL